MEKGTVIEFAVKGQPRLAVVDSPEGKQQFKVIDTFGNALTVHPRDVDFDLSSYKLSEKKPLNPAYLNEWAAQAQKSQAEVDLPTAWELFQDQAGKPVSLEDLASCFWSELTGDRAYALFAVLRDDKVYFKAKAEKFEVRTPAQVEEAQRLLSAAEARQKDQEALSQRLLARCDNPKADLSPEDLKKLESVKLLALYGEEAPQKNAAHDLLALLKRPKTDAGALQLLTDLGIWGPHENLDVIRAGLKAEFDPELIEEAQALMARPGEDWARTDLRALEVITIDDETTTEIDDGLSVEPDGKGGWRFGIHIADPTRWILADTPLDLEARRRGTTVYLPHGKYTMFPSVLAEGPFSLREGEEAPALSFRCTLDATGAIGDPEVCLSVIVPRRRLSYAQADQLLAEGRDPVLEPLAAAARLREALRLSRGAVSINLPESDVKVDLEKNQVEVGVFAAPVSRSLVSEFMVLAGEIAAVFCRDHGIPIPYRGQNASDKAPDLSLVPEGLAREYAKVMTMTRSVTSLEPQAHAGLGLELYTQATSPIRRYGDLVVHRQIKAFLAGQPVLEKEAVEALTGPLDALGSQAAKLERNADRYWILEYLKRHKGQTWEAVMVGWFREDDRQAQVILPQTGLRTVLKLSRPKALGETFMVKVAAVDPRKDLLTWQEAS